MGHPFLLKDEKVCIELDKGLPGQGFVGPCGQEGGTLEYHLSAKIDQPVAPNIL